ncbi:hypothetical protein [Streptomyces sp. NPDC048496]|uniref:hypothetical protein n=1 Tax=Streptomyces sp. NPDC048496 TaxID=3365558 RepID=UPI003718B41F
MDRQWPVPLGHDFVRWIRRRVARGHPVPPHGFHLTPVLQQAATAEVLTHLRRVLLLAVIAVATVVGLALGPTGALLTFLASTWAVCYLDRLLAYARLRRAPWGEERPPRDFRWWIGVRRRRRLRQEPPQRDGLVVPYTLRMRGGDQPLHHMMGAGTVWSDDVIGIDVAPTVPEETRRKETEEERLVRQAFRSAGDLIGGNSGTEGIIPFTPDDLHQHVAAELRRLVDPKPGFHPDNRLDVFEVAAVSAERWRDISDDEWTSLVTLAREGTGAPGASTATKEARRFLCTRIVSWDGELVASLYVSFAYEHHFLRVTTRPHVINPVHPALRTGVREAERGGVAWHSRSALNALLDVFALLNRLRAPLRSRRPPMDPGKGPVSLREVFSSHFMDDMLQYDDARRYLDWMQRRVFHAVLDFLKAHDVDISAFLKQATYVLQNSGVINSGVMGDVQNQPGARNSMTTMTRTMPDEGDKK